MKPLSHLHSKLMLERRSKGLQTTQLKKKTYSKSAQVELVILQLIHANNRVSRIELVSQTGLSAGSMTAITRRLMARGLIVESGSPPSKLGRRPVLLTVRNDAAYLVGVDLGSFSLRVVITDAVGNVVHKLQTEARISEGRERVLERTFKAIRTAIQDSQISLGNIKGIGMGHSGVIDSENGMVVSFPRPGQKTEWKNVPLRDMLEREFGVSCILEDSVRAITIAERHFGLGLNLDDFVYIDIGMGIGAGFFINGVLYRGPGGSAGEFGHMTVDEIGPLCACGNHGCLEAMASCAAIIQAVRSAIEKGVDSRVRDLTHGNLEEINVEQISQAAMENDSLAFRILDEAVSHIGVALADVVNLLNPHVVIFGGPLFRAAPYLLQSIKRVIKQRALEKSANELQLKVSSLGSEAGAVGAAWMMAERIIEQLYEQSS